tara:strand:+ start:576 stop:1820 length:1245 start_codon:yes stop_codon:yes gene_type:complete
MGLGSFIKKGVGKVFKPIKKIVKKIVKPIAKGVRKIGRELKRGLGKVAKAFGKLGPLGSIALSLILPGLGGALQGWLGNMGSVGKFILNIGEKIGNAAKFVKKGVGRVFSSITNGIEMGMNAVSRPFMQEGARGMGSAFRDFVSNATGGMVDKSAITKGDGIFSSEYVKDASGKSFADMTFDEQKIFKADFSDSGFTAQTNKALHNRNVKSISNQASKFQIDNENLDKIVSKTANKTTIEFRDVDGKIIKTFKAEMPKIKTPTIEEIAAGTTEPTNMWSRLNDPDIGFYDAVKNSDNAKMYGRVTALQTYDYATNPDNLSPDDMQTMRNNGIRATQRAQESLARVDTNNYSTGPAPYQMVNANELGNQDPYGFYLNQIYGQSFANVNQAQQQYLAQNAPGYGATFEDFAMMSYV